MGAGLRIGLGYDVHALVPDRLLVLGGVTIPFELGLDGHSDADVLAHAVMDALLGAARADDIGALFPDDDPAFLGADSMVLLRTVSGHIRGLGFDIVDCDTVVCAQSPRLSPYRQLMRENLASAMGVDVDRVGMKATTSERLGFEGRHEGISARAVVLLERCDRLD